MDRLVSNAVHLELKGESMRRKPPVTHVLETRA